MPVFWILSGVSVVVILLILKAGGVFRKKPRTISSEMLLILPMALVFFGTITIANGFLTAGFATEDSAADALQKNIKETYGVIIADDQIKTLSPSAETLNNLPKDKFASWGPITIEHNGEVIEVTLVNRQGQLQLVSGKDTLTELPKK